MFVAGALSAMLVLAWTARSSLLTAAANICIVDDAFQEANAIVVLVGGLDTRPFAAAELFRRGLAPRILVSDTKTSPAERHGILPREVDLARTSLAKLGVPAGAVAVLGEEVSNTYEEARALGAWARSAGAKRVIVPTEIFVTHRTRWIHGPAIGPVGCQGQRPCDHAARVRRQQLVAARARDHQLSKRDPQIPVLPAALLVALMPETRRRSAVSDSDQLRAGGRLDSLRRTVPVRARSHVTGTRGARALAICLSVWPALPATASAEPCQDFFAAWVQLSERLRRSATHAPPFERAGELFAWAHSVLDQDRR